MRSMIRHSLTRSLVLLSAALLAGCERAVLHPSGDVALQQRNLVIASTLLMLLIIVPVMALTALFGWRYRQNNAKARYEPDWHHSTGLELIIWSAPLLIIIALGAITWIATHTLDPYRRLYRIDAAHKLAKDAKPLRVQVVALDWKWLFVYPDYGIATVNELAAPVDQPIQFQITASSVMNSFYVPALAGMVYAMPAMETQLHAVINQPGSYEGFSANYSGAGFSDMHFRFLGTDQAGFDRWVQQAKAAGGTLGRRDYLSLAQPSEREPVRRWGTVEAGLYDAVVNLCVDPARMCNREMMKIDARGGLGRAGIYNVARLPAPAQGGRYRGFETAYGQDYVLALCGVDPLALWSPAPPPSAPTSVIASAAE